MVQAILEGRKTQTRRIIKKQPHGAGEWILQGISWLFPNVCPYIKLKCPYGQPGDILWVRETWLDDPRGSFDGESSCYYYKANMPDPNIWNGYWRPSIFMPKEACRIRLEVIDVRVEGLNDISEEDAIAEGITLPNYAEEAITDVHYPDPSEIYALLWESINGKGSWGNNPFVWVITFKKL